MDLEKKCLIIGARAVCAHKESKLRAKVNCIDNFVFWASYISCDAIMEYLGNMLDQDKTNQTSDFINKHFGTNIASYRIKLVNDSCKEAFDTLNN